MKGENIRRVIDCKMEVKKPKPIITAEGRESQEQNIKNKGEPWRNEREVIL